MLADSRCNFIHRSSNCSGITIEDCDAILNRTVLADMPPTPAIGFGDISRRSADRPNERTLSDCDPLIIWDQERVDGNAAAK